MASDAPSDFTESEMTALAGKFAAWAGGLPRREQEVLWQMLHAAATAHDDAQGYAAPEAGGPRMAQPGPGLVPSDPPKDWNREVIFRSAFLSACGGLVLPTPR